MDLSVNTSFLRPVFKNEKDTEGSNSFLPQEKMKVPQVAGDAERATHVALPNFVEDDEIAEARGITSLSLFEGNVRKAQLLNSVAAQETSPLVPVMNEDNTLQESSEYSYFGRHDDDSSNESESEKAGQYKFPERISVFTQSFKLDDLTYHALQQDLLSKVDTCIGSCNQIKGLQQQEKKNELSELAKKIEALCKLLKDSDLSDKYLAKVKVSTRSKKGSESEPYEITGYIQILKSSTIPKDTTLKSLNACLGKIRVKLYGDVALEKFQDLNRSGNFKLDAASFISSFMLHAIGVKLLYSQKVNDVYYDKKRDYLGRDEGEVRKDLLDLLYKSCFQACITFLNSLIHKACGSQETRDFHLQPTWFEKLADLIGLDADDGKTYCLMMLKLLSNKAVDNQEQVGEIIDCGGVTKLLQKIVSGLKESQELLTEQDCVNDRDFLFGNVRRELDDSPLYKQKNKEKDFPKTFAFLKTKIKGPNTKVASKIDSFLADDKALLVNEYIKDINRRVLTSLEEQDCQAAIKILVEEKLQFELQTRSNRKTLGVFHEFSGHKGDAMDGDHFVAFMSNVRLSNRSQTRGARNNKPLLLKGDEKLLYKEENFYRTWVFGTKVLEKLSLTGKRQTRIDMVDSAGSYLEIFKVIEGFKTHFNKKIRDFISDAQLAQWVKQIVAGSPLSKLGADEERYKDWTFGQSLINTLKEKLAGIAYLLFGCEVARNPASILVHKMMLDLIETGSEQYSWKTFLVHEGPSTKKSKKAENAATTELKTGGRMPMSVEGAVAAGRYLNRIFSEHLPYPYEYHGADESARVQEMVSNEAWVLRNWLLCKNYLYQYGLNYDGSFDEATLDGTLKLEHNKISKDKKAIEGIQKYCVIRITDNNNQNYFLECLDIDAEGTVGNFKKVAPKEGYTTKSGEELYKTLAENDRSTIFDGVTNTSDGYLAWLFEELEKL